MDKNINLELYDFLNKINTQLYVERLGYNTRIVSKAYVPYNMLNKFIEVIGLKLELIDKEGISCNLCDDNIQIELNKIFKKLNNNIYDYKECFKQNEINHFKEYLGGEYEN